MSFPVVSKLDNIVGMIEKLNKSKISNLRYNRFNVFFTFLSFKLTKCYSTFIQTIKKKDSI